MATSAPRNYQSRNNTRTPTSQSSSRQVSSAAPEQSRSIPQPTWGNQAMQRLLQGGTIQPKLKINPPGDKYEQEADRVADQVMRMPEPQVQRQVDGEDEEETIQTKSATDQNTSLIQRKCAECQQDEPLQRQKTDEQDDEDEILQPKRSLDSVPSVASTISAKISNLRHSKGQPLPQSVRAFMEPRFGHDFSNVRTHTNSQATALSHQINARAFTVGQHIFFNQSEFQPTTTAGQELLAHELTHTLQQGSNTNLTSAPNIQRKIIVAPTGRYMFFDDEYVIRDSTALAISKIASIERLMKNKYLRVFLESPDYKLLTNKSAYGSSDFKLLIDEGEWIKPLREIIQKMEYSKQEFNFSDTQELADEIQKRLEIAIQEFEVAERALKPFLEEVRLIQKGRIPIDEENLRKRLELLPISHKKRLEKELLLWPRAGQMAKMTRVINIVTSSSRKSDVEESKRGLYEISRGEAIVENLQKSAQEMEAKIRSDFEIENRARERAGQPVSNLSERLNQCLNLLLKQSTSEQLHPGYKAATQRAKQQYYRGVEERKSGLHREGTLSRYAQELRLEELISPATIVPVKKGGVKCDKEGGTPAHHVPPITKVLNDLSQAGDGWYFFFISIASYHTVFIGVRSEGGSRSYFLIQMPPKNKHEKTESELETFFNCWWKQGASSRVWQIYAKAQP